MTDSTDSPENQNAKGKDRGSRSIGLHFLLGVTILLLIASPFLYNMEIMSGIDVFVLFGVLAFCLFFELHSLLSVSVLLGASLLILNFWWLLNDPPTGPLLREKRDRVSNEIMDILRANSYCNRLATCEAFPRAGKKGVIISTYMVTDASIHKQMYAKAVDLAHELNVTITLEWYDVTHEKCISKFFKCKPYSVAKVAPITKN